MAKIPSDIPAPPIDPMQLDRFMAGENLRFVNPITQARITWWRSRFGAQGLHPAGVAHALGRNVELPIVYDIDIRDDNRAEVRIGLLSSDQAGTILEAERSILLAENSLSLNFMDIRNDFRRRGNGLQMVTNCYDLAKFLRMNRLAVRAVEERSYIGPRPASSLR